VIYQAETWRWCRHLAKIPVVSSPLLRRRWNRPTVHLRRDAIAPRSARSAWRRRTAEVTRVSIRRYKYKNRSGSCCRPSMIRAVTRRLAVTRPAILILSIASAIHLGSSARLRHRMQFPNWHDLAGRARYSQRLQCNHCGYQIQIPPACTACQPERHIRAPAFAASADWRKSGGQFPNATCRLIPHATGRDRKVDRHHPHCDRARGRSHTSAPIFISKGHHFPHLLWAACRCRSRTSPCGDLRAGGA